MLVSSRSPRSYATTSPSLAQLAGTVFAAGQVVPQTKADCKNTGWQHVVDNRSRPFKNQGECENFVVTGGKNTANGCRHKRT